jgi:hypothetical protein
MPHTFCRRRSPWSAQACLRLLWKPDFSQQIMINQGLKAVASPAPYSHLHRNRQIVRAGVAPPQQACASSFAAHPKRHRRGTAKPRARPRSGRSPGLERRENQPCKGGTAGVPPLQGWFGPLFFPGLAPWALLCRAFSARACFCTGLTRKPVGAESGCQM